MVKFLAVITTAILFGAIVFFSSFALVGLPILAGAVCNWIDPRHRGGGLFLVVFFVLEIPFFFFARSDSSVVHDVRFSFHVLEAWTSLSNHRSQPAVFCVVGVSVLRHVQLVRDSLRTGITLVSAGVLRFTRESQEIV